MKKIKGVFLTTEELELLSECSLEAMRLYVLGLRPCMDIKTGTVGRESRVSISGLAQSARFDPEGRSKRKPYLPTYRQVERLLDEMTRKGLVERSSNEKEKKDMRLVVLLKQAKTSENASFCAKQDGDLTVERRRKGESGKKTLINHRDERFFADTENTVKATPHGDISENQRYKNDEMITVREEIFAPTSQPETAAERTDSLADYDKELRSAGYTHSQVLQSITQLKALKAQGATVEHLRDGIRIAKDRGGVSVAYAAKCAASICQQQRSVSARVSTTTSRQSGRGASAKFDPIAYINRNRANGGVCYDA